MFPAEFLSFFQLGFHKIKNSPPGLFFSLFGNLHLTGEGKFEIFYFMFRRFLTFGSSTGYCFSSGKSLRLSPPFLRR